MTTDAVPAPSWAPETCTLPAVERPLRVAEFDDLFAQTLVRSEWVGPRRLRLTLAGPPDLAATTRELTARETQCCSFFTFTVAAPAPGQVTLEIEVPEAHVDVLAALAARAKLVRGTH